MSGIGGAGELRFRNLFGLCRDEFFAHFEFVGDFGGAGGVEPATFPVLPGRAKQRLNEGTTLLNFDVSLALHGFAAS